MKKVFKFAFMFFSIAVVLLFNTGSSYAFSPLDTLSFIEGVENIDSEGVWSWDKDNNVLTIHDDITVSSIAFYQSSTIILEGDVRVENNTFYGIYCGGTLDIKGVGNISVGSSGDALAIAVDGNLVVDIKGDINITSNGEYFSPFYVQNNFTVICTNMYVQSNFDGIISNGNICIDVTDDLNIQVSQSAILASGDSSNISISVGGNAVIQGNYGIGLYNSLSGNLEIECDGDLNITGEVTSSNDINMLVKGNTVISDYLPGNCIMAENDLSLEFLGDFSASGGFGAIYTNNGSTNLSVSGDAEIISYDGSAMDLGAFSESGAEANLNFEGAVNVSGPYGCINTIGELNLEINGPGVFISKGSSVLKAENVNITCNDDITIQTGCPGEDNEISMIPAVNALDKITLMGHGSLTIDVKERSYISIFAGSVSVEECLTFTTNGIVEILSADIVIKDEAVINALVRVESGINPYLEIYGTYMPSNDLAFIFSGSGLDLSFAPESLLVVDEGIIIDLSNCNIDYTTAAVLVKEGGKIIYPHVVENIEIYSLSMQDWIVGDEPKLPQVKARIFRNGEYIEYLGDVWFMFSDTQEGEYTNDIPTKPGKYYLKVVIRDSKDEFGREFIGTSQIVDFNINNIYYTVSIDGKVDQFIKDSLLFTPIKEGYKFEGWIDQDGKKYPDEIVVTSDLTLTTTWSKVEEIVKPEIDPEVKPEIDPEVKPEIDPEVKPEIKPEVKPEIKPEVKPEIKPEVKPEIKPEVKPEIKPQVKPEIKPQVKPEGTLNTNRPQTGDQSNIISYTVSCFVMVSIFALLRKKQIMKK